MHRLFALILIAGCDELVQTAEDFPDFGFDDDPALSCADIEGDFVAESLSFTGLDDPLRDEDFADFDVTLGFEAPNFGSELLAPLGDPLEGFGSFEAESNRILVNEPLLPGLEPGLTAFACELDGTFEDARFEGTFVRA